ncbi:MAG: DUF4430 domain-containing protein [Candidatus Paceibacterota bacterium]|jgi:hypothetical protein
MKKFIHLGIILFFIASAPLSAYADEPLLIDVPSHCTITDTDGVSHTFPQDGSPSDYLGICLLEAAQEAGLVTFTLTNDPDFGLYVESVNGVAPGATEYWALWSNGAFATCGIGCIPLSQGDTLSLILTDWMTNVESITVVLQAHSLVSPPPPSGGGGGGGIPNSLLNVEDALAYLASTQQGDGSFGSLMLSDWVAIAFAAVDPGDAKAKLREYLRTVTPALSSVTDYERHAMALAALAIDPYSGTPVDTITPIVQAFDGTQIGDPSLDNDDIFALFPLFAVGYRANDPIIQKTTAFILSRQGRDGSWDGSVDLTAAAIQALVQVRMLPDVSLALIRAEGYLRSKQPSDGAGNSFSMSWVRQATSALSWTPSGWEPNSFTKDDHLAELQQSDGGVEPESSGTQTRVWATAYAIPAALGKHWPVLLQSFSRPRNIVDSTSTSIAPSTLPVATPPPPVAIEARIAPPKQAVREKAIEPVLPVLIDLQTAAVADAPAGAFFNNLWDSVSAFFNRFL